MKQKTKMETKYKKIYKPRTGAPFNQEDAYEIGDFIYNKCDQLSTEEILKEIKKNPNHTIAKYIEWDNDRAGNLYRLQQVRDIVNHISVTIERIGDSEPQNISVDIQRAVNSVSNFNETTGMNEGEKVYANYETTMQNPSYRAQIVRKELLILKNWADRNRVYPELKDVCEGIKNLLSNVDLE